MKLKKKSKPTETIYSLPDSISKPMTGLGDYSILLYGEKKIGKTSLSSMFPMNFSMMHEPGGKALSMYQKPVTSWEAFKAYVKLLEKDKTFKTVTVDTIDLAYKNCMKSVCTKLVIDHPGDEGWGKGWEAVRDEFMHWISRLLSCGKGVIFISHAVEKEIKTRTGTTYHRISPTMAGQARDILEGIVDIWAYMCYEKGKRMLVIEGDDHVGAGHRLENNFRYTNKVRIKEIPMGKSKQEAYENFVKAFNNETKPEEVSHSLKVSSLKVKVKR